MKLELDEKLKHRLIGLAVIISLAAIFAPAIMKKSSQNIDDNYSVNVKLPPKPIIPGVVTTDEKDVFKTIKVAKVEIPKVSEENQLPELAKAEMIKSDRIDSNRTVAQLETELNKEKSTVLEPVKVAVNQAAKTSARHSIQAAAKRPVRVAVQPKATPKPSAKAVKALAKAKPAVKSDIYAVQLASFAQLNNAQGLVNKLKAKGYKANFARVASRNGPIYKVYVGHSPRKLDVIKLKSQLASAMQLNGFVVNTGVS